MTKEEAVSLMSQGVKVSHRHFTSTEWMTMKDGKILFEDGYTCEPFQFWLTRQDESWNQGYSIHSANANH